jgi:hypothetical protein
MRMGLACLLWATDGCVWRGAAVGNENGRARLVWCVWR